MKAHRINLLLAVVLLAATPLRGASAASPGIVISQPGTYDGHGAEVGYLFVQASDVVAQNYRVTGYGPGVACVSFEGNRIAIRNIEVSGCGATGVRFWSGTDNLLEDVFIHDPVTRQGQDSWGIYGAEGAGNMTIRRVKVFGSGYTTYAPNGFTIIEDSEFSVPDSLRTDCKGRRVSGGPCQCAEFGIAFKTGNGIIQRNKISGYRQSDAICGGSGAPGAGIDPAACGPYQVCPTNRIVIQQNTISDSHNGIYIGPQNKGLTISDNLFCRNTNAIQDGFSDSTSAITGNAFSGNGIDYARYGRARAAYTGSYKTWGGLCP